MRVLQQFVASSLVMNRWAVGPQSGRLRMTSATLPVRAKLVEPCPASTSAVWPSNPRSGGLLTRSGAACYITRTISWCSGVDASRHRHG